MKKIFRNITFVLIVGNVTLKLTNVYCDVFELQQDAGPLGIVNVTVNNADDFLSFIHINNKSLPIESINPWKKQDPKQWQMLGYAVFFPEGNESPQKVYVAEKRKHNAGDYVANNTNDPNGHVFNYTSNMHTERQLAIVALEEALIQNSLQVAEEEDKSKHFLKGAKIPLVKESFPAPEEDGRYDLKGTLYIYTEYSPCKAGKQESGHLGCVEYYQLIASIFENVKFRVYFKNTDNFFDDKYAWSADALTSLSA